MNIKQATRVGTPSSFRSQAAPGRLLIASVFQAAPGRLLVASIFVSGSAGSFAISVSILLFTCRSLLLTFDSPFHFCIFSEVLTVGLEKLFVEVTLAI